MANLQEGLRIATEITMKDRPPVGQSWARGAQAFAEWEQWDKALEAYEVLLTRPDNPIPVWQTHIQIATAYNAQGETELALAQANLAKEDAPAEVLAQIEAFIGTIGQ
jgi:tetratricopeptide (TPR) repeat protein